MDYYSIVNELEDFSKEVEYATFSLTKSGKIKIFSDLYYKNRYSYYPRPKTKREFYDFYSRYVSYNKFKKLKQEWERTIKDYKATRTSLPEKYELIDMFWL